MKKCNSTPLKGLLMGTLLFGSCIVGQAANNLILKERTGLETSIQLSTIQKISFSNSQVSIQKMDAGVVSFNRSDVRTLRFSPLTALTPVKTAEKLALLRNPVSDVLNGTFSLSANEPVRIQIVNLDGRIVSTNLLQGSTGINSFAIPVNTFSNGMYLLRIQSSDNLITTKFIKK